MARPRSVLSVAVLFMLAASACSGGHEPDPTVTNETARKVQEQLEAEVEKERESAEKQGLTEEVIEEIQENVRERQVRIDEQNSASPYKSMSGADIEAMMNELLQTYEAGPSADVEDRILSTFQDPVVKLYYDNNGPEVKAKRKAIVMRMKELKAEAGGAK
ncbi:MAG: hypothetical protein IPN62_17135 [Flavobacteriales bacterium]|nr:hypothetical protein [Flavobacteriales bacterium]